MAVLLAALYFLYPVGSAYATHCPVDQVHDEAAAEPDTAPCVPASEPDPDPGDDGDDGESGDRRDSGDSGDSGDSDDDGIPDAQDPDDDNDGTPDSRDPDDDNDGTPDNKDRDNSEVPNASPARPVASDNLAFTGPDQLVTLGVTGLLLVGAGGG